MSRQDISCFLQKVGWSAGIHGIFPEKEFIGFIGRVDIGNQIGTLRYWPGKLHFSCSHC